MRVPKGFRAVLVTAAATAAMATAATPAFARAASPAGPPGARYLAQMRETIKLTGQLAPEDLTPQMRDEFTDLYRRWRSEQQ